MPTSSAAYSLLLAALLSPGLTHSCEPGKAAADQVQLDRFDVIDPLDLPAVIPVASDRRDYLKRIIGTMRMVIEDEAPVSDIDCMFGKGEYFWPKDPKKPIKTLLSFESHNFKFGSISVGFERKSTAHAWRRAVLWVHANNYPRGVFDMNFPESFFSDLVLQRAYSEKRDHEPLATVNVFEFRPRQGSLDTLLKFEARPDVTSVREKYPRSFHALSIIRGSPTRLRAGGERS